MEMGSFPVRLRFSALALSALLAFWAPMPSIAAGADFDPVTGYRVAHYRAPVPHDVPGGTVLEPEEIDRLVADERAILLDVMPTEGPGPDPATGRWSIGKPHADIPGSTWLADVGRGHIDGRVEAYFREHLERLTGGDRARPVIIYCQSDCWMAWNAVQRAASWGYTRLYWYRDGIDGWRDLDRPLAPIEPVPLSPR